MYNKLCNNNSGQSNSPRILQFLCSAVHVNFLPYSRSFQQHSCFYYFKSISLHSILLRRMEGWNAKKQILINRRKNATRKERNTGAAVNRNSKIRAQQSSFSTYTVVLWILQNLRTAESPGQTLVVIDKRNVELKMFRK